MQRRDVIMPSPQSVSTGATGLYAILPSPREVDAVINAALGVIIGEDAANQAPEPMQLPPAVRQAVATNITRDAIRRMVAMPRTRVLSIPYFPK